MFTKAKTISIAVFIIIALFILYKIYDQYQDAEQTRGDLKIGVILPLTGQQASYGEDARQALELMQEIFNEKNKDGARKLSFRFKDDQMNDQLIIPVYEQLKNEDVVGIVGPMSSSAAISIAPKLESDGVVVVSPTASAPQLSGMSSNFFRVWPPDGIEGESMALNAYEVLKIKKIAVIYEDSEYGKSVNFVFTNAFESYGGEIISQQPISSAEENYRSVLRKILSGSPEAIYVIAYYPTVGAVLKQLRDMGDEVMVLGASASEDDGLFSIAGKAAEGLIITRPSTPTVSKNPFDLAFQQQYTDKYNEIIGPAASFTYDAASVLISAIKRSGTEANSIVRELKDMDPHIGLTGIINFNRDGDIDKQFELAKVENNKFIKYVDN